MSLSVMSQYSKILPKLDPTTTRRYLFPGISAVAFLFILFHLFFGSSSPAHIPGLSNGNDAGASFKGTYTSLLGANGELDQAKVQAMVQRQQGLLKENIRMAQRMMELEHTNDILEAAATEAATDLANLQKIASGGKEGEGIVKGAEHADGSTAEVGLASIAGGNNGNGGSSGGTSGGAGTASGGTSGTSENTEKKDDEGAGGAAAAIGGGVPVRPGKVGMFGPTDVFVKPKPGVVPLLRPSGPVDSGWDSMDSHGKSGAADDPNYTGNSGNGNTGNTGGTASELPLPQSAIASSADQLKQALESAKANENDSHIEDRVDAAQKVSAMYNAQPTFPPPEPDIVRRRVQYPIVFEPDYGKNDVRVEPNAGKLLDENAIGVLVMACKREDYLKKTLQSLIDSRRYAPGMGGKTDEEKRALFPIVVSQGCQPQAKSDRVIEDFGLEVSGRMELNMATLQRMPTTPIPGEPKFKHKIVRTGYLNIAHHFAFALSRAYNRFHQVIVLEEDLSVSPDFFGYFKAALPYLRKDPALFCVSAWNDNGEEALVTDDRAVHRVDIFPGLGWMVKREVAVNELLPRWPGGYWDEFMRRPDVRKDRQCLRPEVNRVYHFGAKQGASFGQFNKYLTKIKLNHNPIDWSDADNAERMRIAGTVPTYEAWLSGEIRKATPAAGIWAGGIWDRPGDKASARLVYSTLAEYKIIANRFGLMPDFKEGLPRGSYRGTLPFKFNGHQLFLTHRDWP